MASNFFAKKSATHKETGINYKKTTIIRRIKQTNYQKKSEV